MHVILFLPFRIEEFVDLGFQIRVWNLDGSYSKTTCQLSELFFFLLPFVMKTRLKPLIGLFCIGIATNENNIKKQKTSPGQCNHLHRTGIWQKQPNMTLNDCFMHLTTNLARFDLFLIMKSYFWGCHSHSDERFLKAVEYLRIQHLIFFSQEIERFEYSRTKCTKSDWYWKIMQKQSFICDIIKFYICALSLSIHIYIYIYIYTYLYKYSIKYIYIYIYIYTQYFIHILPHIYIYTHTYNYIHTMFNI